MVDHCRLSYYSNIHVSLHRERSRANERTAIIFSISFMVTIPKVDLQVKKKIVPRFKRAHRRKQCEKRELYIIESKNQLKTKTIENKWKIYMIIHTTKVKVKLEQLSTILCWFIHTKRVVYLHVLFFSSNAFFHSSQFMTSLCL